MIVNIVASPVCEPHKFFGVKIISHCGDVLKIYGCRLSSMGARTTFPSKLTLMQNYLEDARKFCVSKNWEIESQVIEQPISWDKLDELLG